MRVGSILLLGATLLGVAPAAVSATPALRPGRLTVLPQDGRELYQLAFAAARREIRIEICVLEDPQILAGLQAALGRGVRVRAIVDRGKYEAIAAERANLATYLTAAGGELHLSNPIFPRSFPKVILIDREQVVVGSACLDSTTFAQYRDFALASTDPGLIRDLERLFENDWTWSAAVGETAPAFNPTPPLARRDLIVAPVNAGSRLVAFYQQARHSLDVYTETLGNPTLQSEVVAAVRRGVRVRLIAPLEVNGATPEVQALQFASITALIAEGVQVHVSVPPETAGLPYMHARAAIIDGRIAYLGSVSLEPNSITFNREVGLILHDVLAVRDLQAWFESDFALRTRVP